MKSLASLTAVYSYDALKRLSNRTVGTIETDYTYRNISTERTTTQVSGLACSGLADALTYTYAYGSLGNITQVTENGNATQYTYDSQSQLTGVTDSS